MDEFSLDVHVNTENVKYSPHGAYIEYDTLNFSIQDSTSIQNVLKVSSLMIVTNWRLLTLNYILSTEYIMRLQCTFIFAQ